MIFLTLCTKGGQTWEGPAIEADSYEQAKVYARQIQALENQTGKSFDKMEIVGKATTRVSSIRCGSCGQGWVAVYPIETKLLFCPRCHLQVPLD